MQATWIETETTIDTVSCKGQDITLTNVKAMKNLVNNDIIIHPSALFEAEMQQLAKQVNVEFRDIATLLAIQAKPGLFKEGETLYKYHLQKQLFYFWKRLEKMGVAKFPEEEFVAAKNGPVPKELNNDLERLVSDGVLSVKKEKWRDTESKRIILTPKGVALAECIWGLVPDLLLEVATDVKERIFPLDPETVRHKVHQEFPQYKNSYIENDIE